MDRCKYKRTVVDRLDWLDWLIGGASKSSTSARVLEGQLALHFRPIAQAGPALQGPRRRSDLRRAELHLGKFAILAEILELETWIL